MRISTGLKKTLYLLFFLLAWTSCSLKDKPSVVKVSGKTMGTTYTVTAIGSATTSQLQQALDSFLLAINSEVNNYDSTSMISKLNRGDTLSLSIPEEIDRLHYRAGEHLCSSVIQSKNPYGDSNGKFDPTISPLVEYYGFGVSRRSDSAVDSNEIRRLLQSVGFDKVLSAEIVGGEMELFLKHPDASLNLSAVAKGYAVDQLGHLLKERFGISSYFVEIGGETRVLGSSPRNTPWGIGINIPNEKASIEDIGLIVSLSSGALATSGNYRNKRMRGDQLLVHTIDPLTGSAKPSNLLSATVLADNCATADAYATACMATGASAKQVLAKAGLSGCLIFSNPDSSLNTVYVGDFEDYVVANQGL